VSTYEERFGPQNQKVREFPADATVDLLGLCAGDRAFDITASC